MADVIMPQMGESIAEGTVTKWLKAVGDTIERDEPLFEISTDKVDAEIPAPAAGVLREIRVPPGTTVEVNTVVALIEEAGSASADAEPAAADGAPAQAETAPPAEPPAPVQQALPVEPSRPIPAPDPPAPPTPSSLPPVSYQIEDDRPRAVPRHSPEPPREMTAEELRQSRSSPVVRKIAAEHDVDISGVAGTGIGGRVTKQDILEHIDRRASPSPTPSPAPPPATAPPPPSVRPSPPPAVGASPPLQDGRVELVPMSPIRKKTAEHMLLSKRTSAHVSTVFEIDMTRVDELRKKHRESWEQTSGVRLTYLPFILKAVVDALKSFPILNARVDGDNIAYHKDINLGVAVALDWGLIVPVIHRADEKNLLGLARTVNDIAERARAKKLRVEEVQGGTFTLTNPGVFGSLFGTPIIHQPQVAILGTGAIEKRPVVRDDAIAIRTMAYFALTFDHRIVDGSDADRFMAQIKKGLQEFDEVAL